MKTKDRVISCQLAKKILETAKRKGVELPESEWRWELYDPHLEEVSKETLISYTISPKREYPEYWRLLHKHNKTYNKHSLPAYTTDELLEWLSKKITISLTNATHVGYMPRWMAQGHFLIKNFPMLHKEFSETPAEALGKLLLYLLENDLIKNLKKEEK